MITHRTAALAALLAALAASPSYGQLTHRWSFDTDATDSVGSSNWAVNGATFSGGEVVFDGVDDYLELTTTPLPTASGASTTIEIWGTYDRLTAHGSRIFDFASANGDYYMYLTPNRQPYAEDQGVTTSVGWDDDFDAEFGPDSLDRAPGQSNSGEEVLLTLVIDADAPAGNGTVGAFGRFTLYRDGVEIAAEGNPDAFLNDSLLSILAGVDSTRLGHGTSLPEGPANAISLPDFLNGSINEMRIYSNAMSASDQLLSAIAGPNAMAPSSFADKTWNGGAGDWASAGNWAGGVPGVGDNAALTDGATVNVTSAVPQVGTITTPNNAVLNIGAGGSLDAKYPIALTDSGSISVNGGGQLAVSVVQGDEVSASDMLAIDNGSLSANFNNSRVDANVTVDVGAGGATLSAPAGQKLTIVGPVTGDGDITIEGAGEVSLLGGTTNTFTGTVFVNNSTLDLAEGGGFQSTSTAAQLVLNNATFEFNPGGGGGEVFLTPIHVTDGTVNHFVHRSNGDDGARAPNFQGGLTGDGTITFEAPDRNLSLPMGDGPAIGLDFGGEVDHSTFTGRYVINEHDDPAMSIAIRFRSEGSDFPNAVFEIADPGTWMGKRGTDPNQTIEIGGLAGVAGTRAEAGIPPAMDEGQPDYRDVTYQLGGANEDVDFAGRIHDTNPDATVSITKIGDNAQTLSGPNDYSGPTIVNGGALLVNGTHASLVDDPGTVDVDEATSPVNDYTVNSGGTLGGTGVIGRAGDLVDVNVLGGTIAPGASVGTLTVVGGLSFGDDSTFAVEGEGSVFDKIIAETLSIGANVDLDVSTLGSVAGGDYVIAEYGGVLSGTFATVTEGFSVDYSTPGQILLSVTSVIALPGDYNDDGVVDAADYTVYRDNAGTSNTLPNDAIGGLIGSGHYDQWSDNYGSSLPPSLAVPEPSTLVVLAGCVAVVASRRARG